MDLAYFKVVTSGHFHTDKNFMFSTSLKMLRYSEIKYQQATYGTYDYTFDIHYYDFSTNTYTGSSYNKVESVCNILKSMFNEYKDYEMIS